MKNIHRWRTGTAPNYSYTWAESDPGGGVIVDTKAVPQEVCLSTALGYSGSGGFKNSDGVQYTQIDLLENMTLTHGVIVVDDQVNLPASAALEISLYADSSDTPSGSKLATTGVIAVDSISQGRNELAFTASYEVPADGKYWIGISNFDNNKLQIAMTPGRRRKGIFSTKVAFDKVSSSQLDPVVPNNLADSTEALVFVAVKG